MSMLRLKFAMIFFEGGLILFWALLSCSKGQTNRAPLRSILPVTAYTVELFAGDTTKGFKDGTGKAARFDSPWGIVIDKGGNLYVSDQTSNCIRMITTPGAVVTTLAGSLNGSKGYKNDTGTAALFDHPNGLAIDDSNNLYVADQTNNKIRVIAIASRKVKTFLETVTFSSPSSITTDLRGNFYITETGLNRIRAFRAPDAVSILTGGSVSGDTLNGIGVAARFDDPEALTIDAKGETLYVCDHRNNRIRKVTVQGAVVTNLAGSGKSLSTNAIGKLAAFNGPLGINIDTQGDLYVTEYYSHNIRKILMPQAEVITIAGKGSPGFKDGAGTAAMFKQPSRIAIDNQGNLYVTDAGNHCIRKLTPIKR